MLRMPRVGQGTQELVVTSDATNNLRRTGSFSCQDERILGPRVRIDDPFQNYVVLPTVAKVVFVHHRVLRLAQNPRQANTPVIFVVGTVLGVGFPVVGLPNQKLVKMAIRPAHDELQDVVESKQGDVVQHLDPAPNQRLRPPQRDLALVDLLASLHLRHP